MDDTLDRLVRFRELGKVASRVTPEVLDELCAMSPATIDRYLKPHKDAHYPVALGTTKPSHILRSSIAVRTSMDALPDGGGFYELDTVAHCGHTTKGEYLYTLTMTDPRHGWTMLRAIKNKAHVHVHAALEWMRKNAPLAVTGMDFDNGSEFMNWAVIAWADTHNIQVTRGRPYTHNDNAHVEQRNGDWVRKHAYRYRYETDHELQLLNELWRLVEQRKNHLLPCVKVIGTKASRSGRKRAIYDKPEPPYSRLMRSGLLDERTRAKLAAVHETLNPARITRRINQIQQQLIELAAARTQGTRPAA
ncbi:integrase catalytic domain-containing protein [Leucobacter insecticola]|uniref:integrase catalytic domain-containing protein n=1 Tax=Leucobacter insecticola TaxID=2714934 RepID=UPI001FCB2D31|nr:DDE-type integrase/transposase/recombinase [Leucobacter insecticola]